MPRQPSKKQLGYLKALGYAGTAPETSGEASTLIDQIKGGMTPHAAERQLLEYRRERSRQRDEYALQDALSYLDGLESMMRDSDGEFRCAGFRLKAIKSEISPEHLIYDRAFLPFETAKGYVELLMLPGLDYDELSRRPGRGKFVEAPGHVVEIEKGERPAARSKSQGCLVGILIVAAAAGVALALRA